MSHVSPRPAWERYQRQIEALRDRKANFDLAREHEYTEALGWRIDSYQAELPVEPPGEPLPRGSWALAKEVIANYEFPDPGLIQGIYLPDGPIEGRVMLLQARFLFFTFFFGVRIGRIIDEVREENGQQARVWGFSYHTLEGHFEMGQATFTVWKFLESGTVQFRFNAYSKVAHIPNIFYRIGFRLFGRTLQKRFAKQIQQRMQMIVTQRLRAATQDVPEPEIATPEVQPASAQPETAEKLQEVREDARAARTKQENKQAP